MAYDDKDPSKEVKSLASRFPKRGIDPTIPEGVRRQMMDIQRQEELDKGIKAHEERRLSKGGSAKGMNMKKKFADGGMIHPRQLDSVTGKPYDPSYLDPTPVGDNLIRLRSPDMMDIMPDPRLMRGSNVPSRIQSEYKKGGEVAAYAKGGSVGNVSSRADGCAQRGRTKCKIV